MCMLATGVVPDGASTLHEPQQRLERTWKQTSLREPAVAMRWSNGCTAIGTPANTPAQPTAAASFASTLPSVGAAPGTCSHKPPTPFRHAVATWALQVVGMQVYRWWLGVTASSSMDTLNSAPSSSSSCPATALDTASAAASSSNPADFKLASVSSSKLFAFTGGQQQRTGIVVST